MSSNKIALFPILYMKYPVRSVVITLPTKLSYHPWSSTSLNVLVAPDLYAKILVDYIVLEKMVSVDNRDHLIEIIHWVDSGLWFTQIWLIVVKECKLTPSL